MNFGLIPRYHKFRSVSLLEIIPQSIRDNACWLNAHIPYVRYSFPTRCEWLSPAVGSLLQFAIGSPCISPLARASNGTISIAELHRFCWGCFSLMCCTEYMQNEYIFLSSVESEFPSLLQSNEYNARLVELVRTSIQAFKPSTVESRPEPR